MGLHLRIKSPNPLLVGGAMCPSWKMMEFVNGKDDIPYNYGKQNSCLKPPTRYSYIPLSIYLYFPLNRVMLMFSSSKPWETAVGLQDWNLTKNLFPHGVPVVNLTWQAILVSKRRNRYPLVNLYSLLLKMAIEIVDLPINSMVISHSYVKVYQRVQ